MKISGIVHINLQVIFGIYLLAKMTIIFCFDISHKIVLKFRLSGSRNIKTEIGKKKKKEYKKLNRISVEIWQI